jgi:hypothetical protein
MDHLATDKNINLKSTLFKKSLQKLKKLSFQKKIE